MFKQIPLFIVLISLGACTSIERLAIPDKTLIQANLSQSGQQDKIDHAQWDSFLSSYTAKDNQGVVRVNYEGVSKADHESLKGYINDLSQTDTSKLSKNAQLAYWANLYNATTVNVILENYPVSSIRDIKDGFLDFGPWNDKRLTINNRPTSLHDIENGIVRPLWSDTPEVHYILNCAAAGCPNLSQQAFTAENVKTLMHEAARSYVNDPLRGVTVQDDGQIITSKIYAWYLDDFGGSELSILNHIRSYADPALKTALSNKKRIDHYVYDWKLNDVKNANSLHKPVAPSAPDYN